MEEFRGYKRGQNLFLYDTDLQKGFNDEINKADVVFLCVPTPKSGNGGADLSALENAFSKIKENKIVVIKSTVPPGTTEYFQKKYPKIKFSSTQNF